MNLLMNKSKTATDTPWQFFIAIFIKMTDIVIFTMIKYGCPINWIGVFSLPC